MWNEKTLDSGNLPHLNMKTRQTLLLDTYV